MLLLDDRQAETFRQRVNADPEFALKACDMALDLAVAVGPERRLLVFRDGALIAVRRYMKLSEPIDITISAGADFWSKLLAPVPPPRYQNLYAGVRFATCEVSGNAELFNAYYAALTRLVEMMREMTAK